MSDARVHPPSEQRLAEARRAGHVPRAPLAPVLAGGAALLAALHWAGAVFAEGLRALLEQPLSAAARGETPSAQAVLALAAQRVLMPLAGCLLGVFVALAVVTMLAQGPAFGLRSATRLRLPELRAPRTARVLFVLGLPASCALVLAQALRATPNSWAHVLVQWGLYALLWLCACAFVELSFARAQHVRSLWMTRSEYKHDLREAYGSPEVRALRERVRKELAIQERP